jgi:predicted PilT family ATPase
VHFKRVSHGGGGSGIIRGRLHIVKEGTDALKCVVVPWVVVLEVEHQDKAGRKKQFAKL